MEADKTFGLLHGSKSRHELKGNAYTANIFLNCPTEYKLGDFLVNLPLNQTSCEIASNLLLKETVFSFSSGTIWLSFRASLVIKKLCLTELSPLE